MSIQIYILSKLMQGENYPYQLKKELSDPVPFDKIGNISESKLYYHFESLTKQGLIEPTTVIKEENRPDKQLFAITEKGKQQLPMKIYDVFEKASKMSELVIGLMFVEYVEIDKVIPIVQTKKMKLEKKQRQILSIAAHMNTPANHVSRAQFATNYMMEMSQREIEWHEQLIIELNHLKTGHSS